VHRDVEEGTQDTANLKMGAASLQYPALELLMEISSRTGIDSVSQ
jgi:hypothetical protein